MFFSWWKNRRRRKLLAEGFPPAWEEILRDGVRHDSVLGDADRVKLRQAIQIISAEKDWEGCRGLEITDEIRVVISALAAILILGMDDFYFDHVQTLLVYPSTFVVTQEKGLVGGVALHEENDHLGEAHSRGPVILAWAEVRENAQRPGFGQNLVFHEFAHQLDILNGAFDGTPNLPTRELDDRWSRIMNAEYLRLQKAERVGRETLLDPYGASDPAEFFAVATECFFDAPRGMRDEYRELYLLFRDYYRQDPASWREFQ